MAARVLRSLTETCDLRCWKAIWSSHSPAANQRRHSNPYAHWPWAPILARVAAC